MPSPTQATASAPVLLGHRGARLYAPENTIAAFDLALAHGCDGFEFDVRLSADSILVVCHDPKLAGAAVAHSTCAQLQGLHPAPTLEDVLARYCSSAVLDIELKVGGLELLVLEALKRYPPQRDYWVTSFLPEVLTRLRRLDSAVPLGLICDRPSQLAGWNSLPIDALFLHSRLLTAARILEVHAAEKQVFGWTVNDSRRMRQLAALGIDGILSDDTQLLARTLR